MILFREIRYIVIKYHYRLLIVVLERTGARVGDEAYPQQIRTAPLSDESERTRPAVTE